MKFLLMTLIAAIAMVFSAPLFATTATAAFQPFERICKEDTSTGSTVCEERNQSESLEGDNSIFGKDGIVMKIAGILSLAVAAASIIVIIIGGLKYVLSSGDSNNTNGARNTVLYAVAGLVVAASAQLIIRFVINRL